MWDYIVNHFTEYIGTGLIFIYYLACVIRMFVTERRKEYRILFIYMPAVVLLLFFNPLVAKMLKTYADDTIYYRIMWLIPVSVTIAYTVVDLCCSLKGKSRILALLLSAVLLIVGGRLVYFDNEYSVAENEYHMPQPVVDICDELVVPGREIMVAFPTEMLVYVRQYTPMIVMPYGYEELKYLYLKYDDPIHAQIRAEEPDAQILFTEAGNRGCHYVVIDENKSIEGNPENYGFYEYIHVDGYVIYRNSAANFDV
ncbi:MAG: hypothetical protein MJ130_06135 [Lachnospiraceae bacterium]|nr:hypothetical protein [Lachnospiraceae bacterium]